MRKLLATGCLLAVTLVACAGSYFLLTFPKVGAPPDLHVEATPQRLARGEYLVKSVCACLDCHSERDWSKFAGPVKPGTEGCGGEAFPLPFGTLYAPNITQLSDWTDGELYRAIAEGVAKDGRALFPLMPYPRYGKMASEDLYSIIAYLRTLKPIPKTVPATKLDFPMNLIVRTMPHKAEPMPDAPNNGSYLVNAAACADCHTPQDKGAPIPGKDFAGGFEFKLPDGTTVRSANLTPDPTGLGTWDVKRFIDRFRVMKGPPTIMPWACYEGLTDADLAAIYLYLRTEPPVRN